ncbi:MAG TPA: HIT domain-containing protein [Geobacteraceae bacterium]|nr:HIT domain-containing protein [Geobacteraceae bacterium]
MKRVWAPWRMEYIADSKAKGCIFCIPPESGNDREKLIFFRSRFSFVMLNRYPYTNGHLMIAPFRHTADLNDLADDEMLDLFSVLRICRNALQETAGPQGFNIGINLGKAAGAGVDEHMHIHIVPRWNGDTNFMTVIGDIRVMPENLMRTYDALLPSLQAAKR